MVIASSCWRANPVIGAWAPHQVNVLCSLWNTLCIGELGDVCNDVLCLLKIVVQSDTDIRTESVNLLVLPIYITATCNYFLNYWYMLLVHYVNKQLCCVHQVSYPLTHPL